MRRLEIEQGTEEWKILRQKKIGASDCPTIMGFGYVSPLTLWRQKVRGEESYVSDAMRRGSELEPAVRDILNSPFGCGMNFQPVVVQSDEHEWMIASLDGYDEVTGEIIEIKCPNQETFNAFRAYGTIPDYWYWQVQHQMSVTGNRKVRIYAYNGSNLAHNDVMRDEAAIKDLITKEKAFYKSILDEIEPEDPLPEWDDPETVMIMEQRIEAEENAKRWKERSEELKELLVERSQGAEFRCLGKKVMLKTREGNIDYKAVPELKGVDLEKYRKPATSYWSIA